jgi:hypothetical protein
MKSAIGLLSITLWLVACSPLRHSNNKPIETIKIECQILAREKSLSDAITQADQDIYSEHLANNRGDKNNLDLAFTELLHKTKLLSANKYDPQRSEIRRYYGLIILRRHNTLAYVSHGFGIVGCLGCRALRVDDVNTAKSVWQLESDGQWRRRYNTAGPNVSVFRFKHNETRCMDIENIQ